MSADLDQTAEALADARRRVVDALVVASVYVDRAASEGDPVAREVSRLIAGAFDALTVTNIAATTTIQEMNRDR